MGSHGGLHMERKQHGQHGGDLIKGGLLGGGWGGGGRAWEGGRGEGVGGGGWGENKGVLTRTSTYEAIVGAWILDRGILDQPTRTDQSYSQKIISISGTEVLARGRTRMGL